MTLCVADVWHVVYSVFRHPLDCHMLRDTYIHYSCALVCRYLANSTD
jgi:hypothetical protein